MSLLTGFFFNSHIQLKVKKEKLISVQRGHAGHPVQQGLMYATP